MSTTKIKRDLYFGMYPVIPTDGFRSLLLYCDFSLARLTIGFVLFVTSIFRVMLKMEKKLLGNSYLLLFMRHAVGSSISQQAGYSQYVSTENFQSIMQNKCNTLNYCATL